MGQIQPRSLQQLLLLSLLLLCQTGQGVLRIALLLGEPFALPDHGVAFDLGCFRGLARLVVAQMANTSLDTSGTWSVLYANESPKLVVAEEIQMVYQAPIQSELLPSRMSYAVIGAIMP